MIRMRACIDVPDLERGIAFYTSALGLHLGRRFDTHWAELLGASSAIDLLATPAGSTASPKTGATRDYGRHWTAVHLDLEVPDLDVAVARAVRAGAVLEIPIRTEPYGRLANMADPFGHGFCLLEMNERGYDALVSPDAPT